VDASRVSLVVGRVFAVEVVLAQAFLVVGRDEPTGLVVD